MNWEAPLASARQSGMTGGGGGGRIAKIAVIGRTRSRGRLRSTVVAQLPAFWMSWESKHVSALES
jgi:hypothetical protein